MTYQFDERFLAMPEQQPALQAPCDAAQQAKLACLCAFIWPQADQAAILHQFRELVTAAQARIPPAVQASTSWSEQQLVLICYGDHVRSNQPDISPLQALGKFCRQQFAEDGFAQLTLHLLPIYTSPYKDGGFDITDPFAVNPAMGTWEDVRTLTQQFNVAVDFVANHLSVASPWFAAYLRDEAPYQDFFIGVDNEAAVRRLETEALPHIYRPRPHNPFIPVTKPDGSTRWVYMTFSDHQPDVDYHNPFVFLKMTEVLLFYILQGITMLRLDAIPYLWKEWGTPCAHHPRTHALVELTRLACDLVNPDVKLLAESMEPLADSQRYLSTAEEAKAHLAYNFVPCGLIPHSLLAGDGSEFQRHLSHFSPPGPEVNWAVVCGVTHDGSSLNPCRAPKSVEGEAILTEAQINAIARFYTERGYQEITARSHLDADSPLYVVPSFADRFMQRHDEKPRFANYKTVMDAQGQAQQIVYETISTYASVFGQQPEKIVNALSMALALPGIPFLYFTSMLAILNDYAYYLETGNPRELNRGRVILEEVTQQLQEQHSLTSQVFQQYKRILQLRVSHPAFHPQSALIPLSITNSSVLAFARQSQDARHTVVVLHNVSDSTQTVTLDLPQFLPDAFKSFRDLLSEQGVTVQSGILTLELGAYGMAWLDGVS